MSITDTPVWLGRDVYGRPVDYRPATADEIAEKGTFGPYRSNFPEDDDHTVWELSTLGAYRREVEELYG